MNEKKKNYIIISLISLFLISSIFFILNSKKIPDDKNVQPAEENKQVSGVYNQSDENITVSDESTPREKNISLYYLLINENDSLNLYEINDKRKTLIKSVNFNSDFLPFDDRESLKHGIRKNTKEELYKLIEDFSS